MDKGVVLGNKTPTNFTPNKEGTIHSNIKMGGCTIYINNTTREIIRTTIIIIIPVVLKFQIGTTAARVTKKVQTDITYKCYLPPETSDIRITGRVPINDTRSRYNTNRNSYNRGTPDG